jgi:hypothetical protein
MRVRSRDAPLTFFFFFFFLWVVCLGTLAVLDDLFDEQPALAARLAHSLLDILQGVAPQTLYFEDAEYVCVTFFPLLFFALFINLAKLDTSVSSNNFLTASRGVRRKSRVCSTPAGFRLRWRKVARKKSCSWRDSPPRLAKDSTRVFQYHSFCVPSLMRRMASPPMTHC